MTGELVEFGHHEMVTGPGTSGARAGSGWRVSLYEALSMNT